MSLCDIVVVTWNLPEYLYPCIQSILMNTNHADYRVVIVNNGDPRHTEQIPQDSRVVVLQEKDNKGWEGGLKDALEFSDAPFIVFANDDIFIPSHQKEWLNSLLKHFDDPKVGAVGPTSNTVMGEQQMFHPTPKEVLEVPFLINFFNLIRRSALNEVGGVDDTLSGGDDLDQSYRLRKAGYRLLCDRNVFVWHHGFKSGERKHGKDYNSVNQVEATNWGLMRKHGLKGFLDIWKAA